MSQTLFSMQFLVATLLNMSLSSAASAFGGVVNNGGDVLYVGDTVKMFDEVECSDAFSPELSTDGSIHDAFQVISGQVGTLEKKLPTTGKYLRTVFSGGVALWCFVTGELKEVHDEGPTSLVISYDHQQVAVNQRGVIKIRRDIWDRMNTASRATLLLHEALWTAVGPEYVTSGAQIRQLTNLFMAPSLSTFTAGNLGRFIKQFIGDFGQTSKIVGLVNYDLASAGGLTNYTVGEVSGDRSTDLVVTVRRDDSPLNGKKITGINPNPLYPFIWASRDHLVWNDINATYYDPENQATSMNWQPVRNRMDLCGRMNYGSTAGWRLPTLSELQVLLELEMPQWTYIQRRTSFRYAGAIPPGSGVHSWLSPVESTFLYPTIDTLPLLAADLSIVDLRENLRELTLLYPTSTNSGFATPLKYPSYICIHD